jgi:hypothetical protein
MIRESAREAVKSCVSMSVRVSPCQSCFTLSVRVDTADGIVRCNKMQVFIIGIQ